MTIRVEVTDTTAQIEDAILEEISKQYNEKVAKYRRRIYRGLRRAVTNWIISSKTIDSLLNEGQPRTLNTEFGFPRGAAPRAVAEIVEAIRESVIVKIDPIRFSKRKGPAKGKITIGIQPSSFVNLLQLDEATIVTEKGIPLDWLTWLLTRGDEVIVVGYHYVGQIDKGRSQGGFMRKGGGMWRVDPEHSGTPEDNFITRALSGKEREITHILREAMLEA